MPRSFSCKVWVRYSKTRTRGSTGRWLEAPSAASCTPDAKQTRTRITFVSRFPMLLTSVWQVFSAALQGASVSAAPSIASSSVAQGVVETSSSACQTS